LEKPSWQKKRRGGKNPLERETGKKSEKELGRSTMFEKVTRKQSGKRQMKSCLPENPEK